MLYPLRNVHVSRHGGDLTGVLQVRKTSLLNTNFRPTYFGARRDKKVPLEKKKTG